MSLSHLRILLFALAPAAGCCVTPPDAEEILNLGFRSPEQTVATFQAGVRGQLARLEFRCFSVDYRARNRLSQLAYREFRERELSSNPWFRKGVADAEIVSSEPLGERRQRILAESHDYRIEVILVREDYWQLWSRDELLADEPLGTGGFDSFVDLLETPGAAPTLVTGAELPENLAYLPVEDLRREMTEFRIGEEWKIDSIRLVPNEESRTSDPPPSP